MAASGVVVWEWQNEFGSWRPYDPSVSTFIESNKSSSYPLLLGSVDPNLYQYVIDLQNMCQTRQGTGTRRNVRRTVYPSTSPLAKGITWQWEGDIAGRWYDYDAEVTEYMESCFCKNKTSIDMSTSKFLLPYFIDLQKMTQTRIETGRIRKIQRVFTKTAYPSDSSSGSCSKRNSTSMSSSMSHKKARYAAAVYGSNSSLVPPLMSNSASSLASTSASSSSPALAQINTVSNMSLSALGGSVSSAQGPLTRQRYNQALSASRQQGQGLSMFQPVPSVQLSQPTNTPVQPSYNALTGGFNFQSSGLLSSVFQPMNSSAAGGLVGGQMPSGPYAPVLPPGGFGTSHHGHFVPQSLLSGSKSSKVRPSHQQSASTSQPHRPLPQRGIIPNYAEKSNKRNSYNTNTAGASDSILDNFSTVLGAPPENEDCCICYEKLVEASGHGNGTQEDHLAIQLEKCAHMFHKLCLRAMYDSGSKDGSVQCPTCKTIYGEKLGNCPRGEMEYRVIDSELEGHEGCKTIQVLYHIASGVQGPEHPHPGTRYSTRGFPRIGYIPDCDKGRKVLQLLIVAWKRRLTFTVGSSTTTGEANTVTWNEIHHKTELRGNYSGHGYPDPNYLDNVLLELATHGITDKDLPSALL